MTATPSAPTAADQSEATAHLVALADLHERLTTDQRAALASSLYELAEYFDPDPAASLAGRWAGSGSRRAGRVPR